MAHRPSALRRANQIAFSITGSGRIIGVGNDDPSSHEPDQFVATKGNLSPAWSRSLFNGLAQIIVQSTREPGEIKRTGTGKGLTPVTATMQSQPRAPRPSLPTEKMIKYENEKPRANKDSSENRGTE